ncbi:MAG TPA: glycosyltransferase [Flavisolibacter sp.]|jgi:glycosyltransferase involved in cell wall biosynthesis|nr:glycosyltransferase [Flavisolibacter sp.]
METNAPIVTVLLPTYNCEAYVQKSIQSILDQTFTNFELLVIDDASTDRTIQVIQEFTDPRIRLIRKQKNTGYTDSLNYGIGIAQGDYIARMDADDISIATRLERQVQFLTSNKDVVLCGCWYQEIPTNHVAKLPVSHEDILVAMLTNNSISHPSVMYRKEFFIRHQLTYNRDFESAEDYELWTRVIALGKIHNLPEVLLHYRLHEQQVSAQRNAFQAQRAALCRKRMLLYLTELPAAEEEILEMILSGTRMRNVPELHQAIAVLDQLAVINSSKAFYKKDAFLAFIEQEKKIVIRNFFIFHSRYNLGILQCFFRLKDGRRHLTGRETRRLIVKSLLSWQVKG